MRILFPIRPDIYGDRIEEFSTAAMTVNLGNHLRMHGHQVGYVTSIGPDRFHAGSKIYSVFPTTSEIHCIAESFMVYREYGYDIMHTHTANFATFKQLRKYMIPSDCVVCTLHIPANIGRSFWFHQDDLRALLEFPNFRLVCVSHSSSYVPLMRALGYEHLLEGRSIPYALDSPPGRVVTIHNGVMDLGIQSVPTSQKIDRFMFVAHFMPSKNVVHTLQMAIENRIHCLYVGRRLPHKRLSPTEEQHAVRCEELIRQNSDIIDYHPVVSYHDCVQMMAQSRCLIILSDIESFGFTPIEAAQVGTPTIWLACQGIDETMGEDSPFRISRKEFKTWKLRRARAAELYRRTILVDTVDQDAASSNVQQRFSMGHCTQSYERLYRDVIQGWAVGTA